MTTAAMTCFFHDRIVQLSLSECCCSLEILIESPYAATRVLIAQLPRHCGEGKRRSNPHLRTLRNGLLRPARNDRGTFLFPRKDRLFEFRDPRSPPRQNFGKLIDQRRRRGVDMLTGMAEADHAPRTFGDRGEAEHLASLDIIERDAMHRGNLRRIGY